MLFLRKSDLENRIKEAYEAGKKAGYKEAKAEYEKNNFTKHDIDMIRQIISVLAYDGGAHEDQENS